MHSLFVRQLRRGAGKLLIVFCITLLTSTHGDAQEINGTWIGNYGRQLLLSHPEKLVVEIMVYDDTLVRGLSHLYYKNNKYEHYTLKGTFNPADTTITFVEDSTISIRLGFMESACLGIYKMKMSANDSMLILQGTWKDKSKGLFKCPGSSVKLYKKRSLDIPDTTTGKDPELPTSAEVSPPVKKVDSIVLSRVTDFQSLVEISPGEKDSIRIDIYDNGEVDGDTVSLYLDNKLLIAKQKVSTVPVTVMISLDHTHPLTKLKLIAESLGSIPPCTALMVITTAKKRHEISLSSNYSTNGTVELFLKE